MRREGIQKLSEVASKEERCLRQAERFLDENATMFDDILKENEKNSVQAIKIAEQETKAKLEKVAEIKAILGKIVAVKSDISKNEEILKECAFYNVFLLKLSPPEWRERQQARTTMVDTIKASIKQRKAQLAEPVKPGRRRESMYRELPPVCDPRTPQSPSVMGTRETVKQVRKEVSEPVDESRLCEYEVRNLLMGYNSPCHTVTVGLTCLDGIHVRPVCCTRQEPEIYFTDPQQLLDLLTDLEKQNLALIQYSREAEETLEGFSHTMENTRKKMEQETKQLTQQIDIMKHTIQREKDRVAELELKARLFSYGEYKAGDQARGGEGSGGEGAAGEAVAQNPGENPG
ncbi:cilia- and flagella-associated protein 100 isoform X3 [Esox lucius]|uniref:cilia- and flagella-associated protein 100 isoform X3 n=1 Tax=Esox lucius TaxID=8010 RepID=UPI0014777EE1|nr:cilia- and flagella-associated protein 100 isoform X3 [Esox lucius]